ncbi:ATP-binding protein [Kineosporia sp. J2-2]|uniref:ATP-binding protein n=1 Tax=Kineosporia corallincola TaxID=2835133 RepID=A0ABS5TAW3_9ACTN|nr:ATP-binding protein [Kineosporia corallincola]MBT0768197.1 ATP-binding protein [Kineosporia corallincola]
MGDGIAARWERFLGGLDAAVQRRVHLRDQSLAQGETPAGDVSALLGSRLAVVEAWNGAPVLFGQLDRALDTLAGAAGLSRFEADLLAVLVAADVDPSLAVALDQLRPSGSPAERPTVGPVLEVLGVANVEPAVRAGLRAGGALHRAGLLRVHGAGPFMGRTLVLPDRVTGHLLGDHEPDAVLHPVLLHAVPLEWPGGEQISRYWQEGAGLVWVHGPLGDAGLSMAAGAAARHGLEVTAVDLSRAATDQQSVLVDAAVLETVLRGGVLVVTGLATDQTGQADPSGQAVPAVLHRLAAARIPAVVVSDTAWDPRWASWLPPTVPAPRLGEEQRRALWSARMGEGAKDPGQWRDLLALRVTPEEIHAVVDLTRLTTGEPTAADLLGTARRLSDQAGVMRRCDVTLDDLVLPSSTRSGLEEMISWGRHRDAVLAQGPLMGKGRGRGIAALFAGGSGTGKTLAAQAVAGSLGLDLYQVDLAAVVDKYIGEAEKRLARIFATAERLNCVLFFDEADALFGARTAVQDAHDRYANLEVSYLLQRLEQFDGLVVLATNLRGNLDAAFTRRLHFVLHFPEPDEDGRMSLWDSHLRHVAEFDTEDPVNTVVLSSVEGVTGGVIKNAVLAAAFAAHHDAQGRVGQRHLATALERELRKMGRRSTAVGRGADLAVSSAVPSVGARS